MDVYSKWLPKNCLIATSTTDGAANEISASKKLVKDGNNIWCCGHLANLCVRGIFDSTSETTKVFRDIIHKAHSLVVYIRGHSNTYSKFSELAKEKSKQNSDFHFETLILDVVTRWDSTLNLLQRVVYFDSEILQLCSMEDCEIPKEYILGREQFDLARVMVDILVHFRIFGKNVQRRNFPTLCYVPSAINTLIEALQPNSETKKWKYLSKSVIENANTLQQLLITEVRERFKWVFESDSLALGAALLCPGESKLRYKHFPITNKVKNKIIEDLEKDAQEFESNKDSISDTRKNYIKYSLKAVLEIVENAKIDEDESPLIWWSKQEPLAIIKPLVEMMLAIPASSAENERTHHGVALTLRPERNRISIRRLQHEFRIQQYFATGNENNKVGENGKIIVEKARALLQQYERWKESKEKDVEHNQQEECIESSEDEGDKSD